jgi:hypothetical protein
VLIGERMKLPNVEQREMRCSRRLKVECAKIGGDTARPSSYWCRNYMLQLFRLFRFFTCGTISTLSDIILIQNALQNVDIWVVNLGQDQASHCDLASNAESLIFP